MPRIQQTLSVDFGSSAIRMFLMPRNEAFSETACIATHTNPSGQEQFMALGALAQQMVGRVPNTVRVHMPIQNGDIVDFESAEMMFKRLMHRIQGRMLWLGPNVIVCSQNQQHEIQSRAIRRLCTVSGARKVDFVVRALSIANALELSPADPHGHMIVDIGHETTDISILSMGNVVYEHRLKVAGKHIALAIIAGLKEKHALVISLEQALSIVKTKLSLRLGSTSTPIEVLGRCLDSQLPRHQLLTLEGLRQMVVQPLYFISESITQMLSVCSARLASDISQSGIILVGGTARLTGLSFYLRKKLKMPVFAPDNPEGLVVLGAHAAVKQ